MLVSSIYDQVAEATGQSDQGVNFQALSRAIELLSNEGLFDPQIGYLNFSNSGSNIVVLPREVKTVLRVNINRTPTFFRNRLFEFTLNSNGSIDGDEPSLAWADRGYSPIQNEQGLPGTVTYVCEDAGDAGQTITVCGKDVDGNEITEVLSATTGIVLGEEEFYEIRQVTRDLTAGVCLLRSGNGSACPGVTNPLLAQYYPDEEAPMYRVIKLSKAISDVRIMFRRDVFEVKSMADFIPVQSRMAIITASKAVRYFADDEYDKATAALSIAVDFLKKEQASRDEQDAMAAAMEVPTATDSQITVRDSIIVSDVYDAACTIFGYIGRWNIFDKITTAIEILRNKAQWDALLGVVDVWMTDRTTEIEVQRGQKGSGYFVLPRFVESVVSLNVCGEPTIPRNSWFQFHMNGTGETGRASFGAWDDAGEVCVLRRFLIDPDTRRVIPAQIVAVPNSSLDDGKNVTVYGIEVLDDGTEREKAATIPCVAGSYDPGDSPINWIRIDRITRDATGDFVKLLTTNGTVPGLLLGFWYPDEIEPKYRAIRTETAKAHRVRILYRKRTAKVSSLFEPIPLRSRIAIETMMRALKYLETDPQAAATYEGMAIGYLSEERINSTPSDTPMLQFDEGTMPGFTGNVM